jgi:hypothetical protein
MKVPGMLFFFFASGGQGLFLKKPPLDPAKTFYLICLEKRCQVCCSSLFVRFAHKVRGVGGLGEKMKRGSVEG